MEILIENSDEVYEIILNYEDDSAFFVNEQLQNYVIYKLSRKLGSHKIRINSFMKEDFKHFSENVKDLYEKCQNSGTDFIIQQEDTLRELEEKYKNYRIAVLKDTVNVYEK